VVVSDLDTRLRDGLSLGETGPLSDRSRSVMRDYIQRTGPEVTVDDVKEHFVTLEESEAVNRWVADAIDAIHGRETEGSA
jgi:hypothetical protein